MWDKIFVDTSAWISYLVPTQPDHQAFKKLFHQAIAGHSLTYTSNDVVDETHTRLRYDMGWPTAKKFIDHFSRAQQTKSVVQLWTDELIQSEAFIFAEKYKDHKLSLTDISSAILMKHFRITTIFTTDHSHFTTLGFRVLPQPK